MIGLLVKGVSEIATNYFDKKKAEVNLKKTEVETRKRILDNPLRIEQIFGCRSILL